MGTREMKSMNVRWGGNDQPAAPVYNITTPATPAAPTAQQTAEEYAKALPIYYQTAMEYEPQMAALQKQINEQLYPNTAGLQETIAGQASTALGQDLPSWYQEKVGENLKSQLGRNLVYNPQAQEQYGLNTQAAYKDYGDYWRNLALSAAGRQPLATSANLANTYTPAVQSNVAANNYGNYVGAYGSMSNAAMSANANMYGSYTNNYNTGNPWMNMGGSILGGGLGSFMGGYGYKMGSR